MATLDDLLTAKTKDEWYSALLALLPPGFGATSWRVGDVLRTLIEIDAQALSEEALVRSQIAKGGLLETSAGEWLTLLAAQVYGLTRNPAQKTVRTVTLTASAEAGPYSISPGQLWVSADSGLRFQSTNTAQETVAKGGTLELTVSAEAAGAAYNAAVVTTLSTPLPGVTVTDGGVATSGVDEESDASLRERCRARWAELGSGSPASAYDLWAKTSHASITRTRVTENGLVAGGVLVYLAGPAGGVGAEVVAAAETYIAARAPLGTIPSVASAVAAPQALTATLYGKAQYEATAKAEAEAAFRALLEVTPIGGKLYGAAKIEALMLPAGVENATIAVGGGDVTLTAAQVATAGAISIGWSNT